MGTSVARGTIEGPRAPLSAKDREERARELRRLLEGSVERSPCETILLSGGLDTSVVAEVARPRGLRTAVTVLVGDHPPDEEHALRVAERLQFEHRVVRTDLEGLLTEVPLVVRVMRTFDPMEVRNSIVVARALRAARESGWTSAFTGDAADELLGGYSFLWQRSEEEFDRACRRMARVMRFSSFPLGKELGVRVVAPFMDPSIVDLALGLPRDLKVGRVGADLHGKLLLREAFPEVPNRWRRKDPIEVGSGSTALPQHFRSSIPSSELEREQHRILRDEGIEVRDAEHLAYYRVFREEFPKGPQVPRHGADPCPKCGYELPSRESDFCITCGAWPARSPTSR